MNRRSVLICGLFFASGAAAVVFETLWFHEARLVLGSSVWAAALVPAGFMAGLGVGNAIAMRRGDRIARPLRAYALLEVIVAISGVLLVRGLPGVAAVLAPVFRSLLDAPAALAAVRLTTAFVLLVVPSTAMGLTLPLLVRALASADAGFGRVLGRLYGWNTLGAVVGALVAEVFLIGALGLRGAALVAGATNLSAACVAWWLSMREAAVAVPASAPAPSLPSPLPWRRLAAAFLFGGALLALEVIWIRFLSLYVLAVSLAFAVMLAIVLAGIGLGGLAASLWLRFDKHAHRFLAPVAFAAGALTIVTYALFPQAREAFGIGQARFAWQVTALGVPLMMPVSFASGMLFTLLGAALRADAAAQGDARAVALLTLANTAGAALGAVLAAVVLLPFAGMELSLFGIALVYGACGALVVRRNGVDRPAKRSISALAVAYALAVACFPFGAMQKVHFAAQIARWSGEPHPQVVVREGPSETILYVERQFAGRTRSQRLVTNGFSMSSSTFRDRRYMKLFVYFPVAVHPAPRSALLICFGVGATAKALTDTRALDTIDVVDVSRDVLELSRVVHPGSTSPLADPRVRVHVEDGRFFLEATGRRFDIITGEPPPPNLDGVEALYSVEYFRLLRERLNEGGIVTYWLPTHSLAEPAARAVVRAFCDAFDDCSTWGGFGTDVMLVGTRGARGPVSEEHFRAQWEDAVVKDEIAALGFERPEQLGALFMADAPYLNEMTAGVLPVVDDFPRRISSPPFFAAYNDTGAGLYGMWSDSAGARARFGKSALIGRLWPASMKPATLAYFDAQAVFNRFAYRSSLRLGDNLRDVHELLTKTTLRAPVLWMLASDPDVQRIIGTLSPEELTKPEVAYHVGCRELSERHYEAAANWLYTASTLRELAAPSLVLRAYALFWAGDRARAEAALVEARRLLALDPSSLTLLAWIEQTFPASEAPKD